MRSSSSIDSLQTSLEQARERLQACREKRELFEQTMDFNSCQEHRKLALLADEEEKLEQELKLIEEQLAERQSSTFYKAKAAFQSYWSSIWQH